MSWWPEVEYQLRRIWERIPIIARRPLRRFLTQLFFPTRTRLPPARSDRASCDTVLFSPPPPPTPPSGQKESPLRVLVEVASLDRGGIEEFVASLVATMDLARFSPMVVCTESGGRIAERCRNAGIPVAVLAGTRRRDYERLLDEHPVDLVNSHDPHLRLPIAAARGIPVVMVIHNTYSWIGPADRRRLRRDDRFVARYIAVSSAVKRYAEQVWGLAPDKVICVNNGIDVSRYEKLLTAPLVVDRKSLGLSERDFVFVNTAAIDAPKGQNVILAALRNLIPKHPEVKVLSVGPVRDEIYFKRISDRVRRWGLEKHFRFVGFTPEVHDFYRLSDAFLLPSLIEGYSLSLIEAAFYGLPIIATRVGGAPDLLEGEPFGLLVDPAYKEISTLGVATMARYALEERPRNTDQLARAMRDFLDRPDHWKAQGPLGRKKVVAFYDIAQTVSRYESLFLELVGIRIGRRDD